MWHDQWLADKRFQDFADYIDDQIAKQMNDSYLEKVKRGGAEDTASARVELSPAKVELGGDLILAPSTRQIFGQSPRSNLSIIRVKEKKIKAIINLLRFRQQIRASSLIPNKKKRDKQIIDQTSSELLRSSQFFYQQDAQVETGPRDEFLQDRSLEYNSKSRAQTHGLNSYCLTNRTRSPNVGGASERQLQGTPSNLTPQKSFPPLRMMKTSSGVVVPVQVSLDMLQNSRLSSLHEHFVGSNPSMGKQELHGSSTEQLATVAHASAIGEDAAEGYVEPSDGKHGLTKITQSDMIKPIKNRKR